MLSHFPLRLKPGKIAILPKEPQGDLQGRLDSVAAGVGTNAVSVAILPKEPQGDLQGRLDSVAAGVGTNVSECCMRPSSAHKFAGIGLQASGIGLQA